MIGHLHKKKDALALDEDAARNSFSTEGSYGLKRCNDPGLNFASIDVVFVHGLTGNRETTWTDTATGIFWPQNLLPEDLPKARILTYGYDADIFHFWALASQSRIGNHAQTLLNALAQLRERTETDERPILFVAHSLGGLLVEDMLLASKNSAEPHMMMILECTKAIAFLGTPHCGSNLASWASTFSNFANLLKKSNTPLVDVLQTDSEVLARIQQEFHTMLRARADKGKPAVKISCFFEDLPVRGVGEIVPKHSAILPAYTSIAIRANHMDMTKFSSSEDPGYFAVSTELWRWARDLMSSVAPMQPATSNYLATANAQARPAGAEQHPQGRALLTESEDRVYQGGNLIQGQNVTGTGKVFQGNNLRSDSGDMTFNL